MAEGKVSMDLFPVFKESIKDVGIWSKIINKPFVILVKLINTWLLSERNQAIKYSGIDERKGPRSLNRNSWNTVNNLFYYEWDYVMIHDENFIGAIGLCLLNPRGTPVIPNGLLFIVYGWDSKNEIPVRLFHLMKGWKGSAKNVDEENLKYVYKGEGMDFFLEITWDLPNLSGNLVVTPKHILPDHSLCDATLGPLGQYWQVNSRWAHCDVKGSITTMQGKVLNVKSTGYNENSGGFTFLINSGWLFFVHTSPNRCVSFQSYVNTPRLTELLLILDGKEHYMKDITFDVIESEKKNLLIGKQYLPTRVHIRCEDDTVKCKFEFIIEGHVEADKSADLMWQQFFICFCRGTIVGRVVSKINATVMDEWNGLLGGEYARHSLWDEPVTVWTKQGRMKPPQKQASS